MLTRACNIQDGFPRTLSVVTSKLAQLTAIDRVGQLWLVVGIQLAELPGKKKTSLRQAHDVNFLLLALDFYQRDDI